MNNILGLPDLLTVNQAAEVFHLCRQTIYKYINSGAIPAFKNPAGKYLIPRKFLDDLTSGCYNSGATNCDRLTKGGIDNVG